MEPEQLIPELETKNKFENLTKVTSLSKYLALVLFVVLPFVGGYIGYTYAPEKVVEVEVVSIVEKSSTPESKELSGFDAYLENVTIEGLSDKSSLLSSTKIFLFDGLLYVLRVMPMGEGLSLKQVNWYTSVPDTFTYVGGKYINDGSNILFLGEMTTDPILIKNADAASFRTIIPDTENNQAFEIFGADNTSLYHRATILEGIDPGQVQFKLDQSGFRLPIVHDADTYWYPEGGCHEAGYRLGTADELDTYTFPC